MEEGRRRVVKIVMMQKDEETLLGDWLWHHCRLVGIQNIHIIDHNSSNPKIIGLLRSMSSLGLDVRTFYGGFEEKSRVVTALLRDLAPVVYFAHGSCCSICFSTDAFTFANLLG